MPFSTPPETFKEFFLQIFSFFWFIAMGVFGATINYLSSLKNGRKFKVRHLVIEWFTAAFVAVCTALVCSAWDTPDNLTYALCGISGHMGGRAISLFERLLINMAEKRL
jgi:hypothetical protein